MRKIIAFNRVSADGYFSAPNGSLSWAVPDDELENASSDGVPRIDTFLFGRKTYDMFESFWPHVLERPDMPNPHGTAHASAALQTFARTLTDTHKVVFSRTRTQTTWKNTRLIAEFDPHEIEQMKQQPGRDIMIFGSSSLVSQLAQHGLVDEFQFNVSPVLLGEGRCLVHGVAAPTPLTLVDVRSFPSGNVSLRYARQ